MFPRCVRIKSDSVTLLRADRINVAPVNDALGAVVLGMDTRNVDSVFIAGRLVKRRGRLVGLNLERLLDQAAAARDRLRRRVGL